VIGCAVIAVYSPFVSGSGMLQCIAPALSLIKQNIRKTVSVLLVRE
jgi:hypothetical protein